MKEIFQEAILAARDFDLRFLWNMRARARACINDVATFFDHLFRQASTRFSGRFSGRLARTSARNIYARVN